MDTLTLFIVFYLLFSVLIGVFANQRRNRSGIGWFLISMLIGPLFAFLFVAVLREKTPAKLVQVEQTH
jgi:biotin transporter BioY